MYCLPGVSWVVVDVFAVGRPAEKNEEADARVMSERW